MKSLRESWMAQAVSEVDFGFYSTFFLSLLALGRTRPRTIMVRQIL